MLPLDRVLLQHILDEVDFVLMNTTAKTYPAAATAAAPKKAAAAQTYPSNHPLKKMLSLR